jgi:hypothetical protein
VTFIEKIADGAMPSCRGNWEVCLPAAKPSKCERNLQARGKSPEIALSVDFSIRNIWAVVVRVSKVAIPFKKPFLPITFPSKTALSAESPLSTL